MRRRLLSLGLPLLALSACGFELRRDAALPFQRIALSGFAPRSPLAEALRTVLSRNITVVPSPDKAQVVLQAIAEARTKKVAAVTASGEVRDVTLRLQFIYRAHTPAERELIARSEINLYRDMTFVESQALGKAQEEAALYREMQSDVVQQVMLRLSAIRPG